MDTGSRIGRLALGIAALVVPALIVLAFVRGWSLPGFGSVEAGPSVIAVCGVPFTEQGKPYAKLDEAALNTGAGWDYKDAFLALAPTFVLAGPKTAQVEWRLHKPGDSRHKSLMTTGQGEFTARMDGSIGVREKMSLVTITYELDPARELLIMEIFRTAAIGRAPDQNTSEPPVRYLAACRFT